MADKPKDQSQAVLSSARLWSLASEIGFKIAVPLVIFLLIGISLDKWLHTLPLFMIVGMLLSFASSSYLVYQIVVEVNREQL